MISDCNTTISSYELSQQQELNDLQNRIAQLERERDNAYGNAIAQSGGYENSYANSIKDNYNAQIRELEQQKMSIKNNYYEKIASQKQQLKQLQAEQAAIPQQKKAELTDSDEWYASELNKIYSE